MFEGKKRLLFTPTNVLNNNAKGRSVIARTSAFLCLTLSISVTSSINTSGGVSPHAARPVSYNGRIVAAQEEMEEVTITLRPEGFDPSKITHVPKRFMLSVDNRSGVEEVVFQLKRGSGHKLREIRISTRGSDWSEMLDLKPGHYTLTEANHPEWECAIVITEK